MTGRRLVVATYNIHACVGTDGKYDPDRIAAVIEQLGADVVALQEVDRRRRPDRPHLTLEQLCGATGYACVAGPNIVGARGDYGNGLLSSRPILAERRIDLTVPRCEPRGAIDVDLDLDGRVVRIVATHLGLFGWERRIQVGRLLAAIGEGEDGAAPPPLVVAGDFNEWHPFSTSLALLKRRLGDGPAPRTFPSFRPLLALDRVFSRVAGATVRVMAHATPLARRASDHLPARAVLDFGDALP